MQGGTGDILTSVARILGKGGATAGRRQAPLAEVPGWDAGRLGQARLVLAGAGALGAEIGRQLALAGIGRLVLADGGRVEPEDVAASGMYRSVDLGMPRAQILQARLAALAPDLKTHVTIDGPLALGAGVVSNCDLVVAADVAPRARLVLDRWSKRAGKAWIDASLGVFHGSFRVYDAARGACLECGIAEGERKALTSALPPAPGAAALGTPPTTCVLAGLVAQAAVKTLCPREGLPDPAGRETFYNGRTDALGTRDLVRRDSCVHPSPAEVMAGPWSGETRLGELLRVAREVLGEDARLELDRPIAWKLECERCALSQQVFRSALTLGEADLACKICGSMRRAEVLAQVAAQTPFLGMQVKAMGLPLLPLFVARSPRGTVLLEPAGDRAAALGNTA